MSCNITNKCKRLDKIKEYLFVEDIKTKFIIFFWI